MEQPPFHMDATIGTDLRAHADDPDEVRHGIAWLEDAAARATSPSQRARLLGRAGHHAGVLRDLARAERLLSEALRLAEDHDDRRAAVVQRIRLADVTALAGDPSAAADALRALLPVVSDRDDLAPLRSFVLQHLGKALLEAGEPAAAVAALERARTLRAADGDVELVASTDQALTVARARASGHDRAEHGPARPRVR